ncbi:MAG: HD domain-containing protein, partial [Candidatus Lokiarchaeota archaeon]|nr:HD domain-containing protein [Candidatus Lokiarchaeota archaeon]
MANQATPRTPRNKTNSKPKLKILQQLDFLFESLENRWNNGLNSFQQQLDQYKNHNRLGIELKKNDIINTPIHKIITINEEYIYLLLDTIFMQRLRGIKHQGLAYLVYPTATHSRFEHSLGAYKITIDIINAIKENPRLYGKHYNYNDIELCIAALLHDIGHYPFSHLGEHAFDDFIYQHKMNYEINNILPDNHEVRTANIIRGGDIFEDLNPKNNPFKDLFDLIGQFNNNIEINVENIANLIEGKEKIEGLSNKDLYDKSNRIKIGHLINGPLDVDKLDYILRESYFTGTPFGSIDIHRIVKGYGVGDIKLTENDSPIPNQLVYNKKMLPSVIQMYIARAFDYSQISYHRTLRIADTTLKTIIDITMNEFINFMEKN